MIVHADVFAKPELILLEIISILALRRKFTFVS